MTNLIIHPEVGPEVIEAVNWYRKIDPELAARFLEEVYASMEHARRTPLHYRIFDDPYRRVLCETFPYRVIFEIIEDWQAVHVVAVLHQKRHPQQWKDRL